MKSKEEILQGLNGFYGTEGYHQLTLPPLKATDGVKYLCDSAECYWLMDIIHSYQAEKKVARASMQVWILTVKEDKSAVVIMTDGDEKELIRQEIEYTTFPLDTIKLYCMNDVILLPGEY